MRPTPEHRSEAIAKYGEAMRGRLAACHAPDLSEATLQTVFGDCAAPDLCLSVTRWMIEDGLTIEAVRNEFGPWRTYHAEIEADRADEAH